MAGSGDRGDKKSGQSRDYPHGADQRQDAGTEPRQPAVPLETFIEADQGVVHRRFRPLGLVLLLAARGSSPASWWRLP
jgi:hypothetical protein